MNKALFLDRDGTIIVEKHFLHKIEDVEFEKHVIESLKLIQRDYLLFIVTNQSGIARGYFTEIDFIKVQHYIINKLNENNIAIRDYMYSPNHTDAKIKQYKKDCNYRKPNPQMLIDLATTYQIDLKKSYMIGDKNVDVEAGKSAGCKTVLLKTGYGNDNLDQSTPDFICNSFKNLIEIL